MSTKALILFLATLSLAGTRASAEEQSWAKRMPPPVKYAPPPPEQKAHDWSGFHMGVNAGSGSGFGTKNPNPAMPGSSSLPR